jgi:hypothetical protein
MSNDPVLIGGASITGVIILAKLIFNFGTTMGWWHLNEEQTAAFLPLLDQGIPIAAVWITVLFLKVKTTRRDNPTDVDGIKLTRPDNTPAIPEMNRLQEEAIKIDKSVASKLTRGFDS